MDSHLRGNDMGKYDNDHGRSGNDIHRRKYEIAMSLRSSQ